MTDALTGKYVGREACSRFLEGPYLMIQPLHLFLDRISNYGLAPTNLTVSQSNQTGAVCKRRWNLRPGHSCRMNERRQLSFM